jgi:ankyrin repeat protein
MQPVLDPLAEIVQAFRADDVARVRQLLDQRPEFKARINEPVGDFDSPPILAVRSPAMLDLLVDAGADLNAKSRWWAGGFGLLHCASPELAAHAITKGAVVDVHAAARLGLIDRLRELIAADPALVHARGGDGQMPLHFAKTIEVAEFLLEHGADINARDVDHESTPAQWALDGRQEISRYLIFRGCQTDVLMAAALGDLDLVRRHLDADPQCVRMRVSDQYFPMIGGKTGGTIYQWALGWYVSAHQVARKFGHEHVYRFLMGRSDPATRLITACWVGDEAALAALRGSAAEIVTTLTPAERRQPAHAARNNDLAALGRMVEAGFPIDGLSQHQGTPLHWAGFHGNAEMARLLLRFNPPLEIKDADFEGTPLGWTIYGSEHGWHCQDGDYVATATALLQAGAKPPEEVGGSQAVRDVLERWRNR